MRGDVISRRFWTRRMILVNSFAHDAIWNANEFGMVFGCGRFHRGVYGRFWMWFACVFQVQQPECFQPNCTFYFRKPLHVFVTSFDVFGSWRRDASALSMVCE